MTRDWARRLPLGDHAGLWSEPAKVSLALDSAHLPTEGEGRWAGLGFRV